MVDERTIDPPVETGVHHGLAYAMWIPDGEPAGGLVILAGAGSHKESHFAYGQAARAMGLAAIAFDQRGHGESAGRLDDRLLDDVAAIRDLLTARIGGGGSPIALRGSSMGGYVALQSAARDPAEAVVAICPAGAEHLLHGLRKQRFDFDADVPALARFLTEHDALTAVAQLRAPLLLMHAEGDEQIPVEHSAKLYAAARMPHKRLLALPGGDHRSIQHDPELQRESLRFVLEAFADAVSGGR
ncbi:MAG: alpha/beta fold hydrolase [Actinomycetota bacterium]|nr:alpha/beta fold hydrolase [Actinomycetota bacterium]